VLFYQIQHHPVSWEIAFVCNFAADCPVLEIIEIPLVLVEYRVMPEPAGLVNLKIKAY
jgi:hypothetical protein